VGAAFAVWLALVYLCDLGAIGLTLAQDLGPAQVFLLGVLNPVQQARILGTLALTDRLEVLGPAGIYAVDTFGAGGAALLLGWMMAAVTAGCLAFGYLRFRRTVVS
jgi:Cu-processing system permease protein